MHHRFRSLPALLTLALLAGCGGQGSAATGPAVATIDGEPISESLFNLYVDNVMRASPELAAGGRDELLDQFISMKLAARQAEGQDLAKNPQVQDQLALARMNVLVDAGLQQWLEANPVDDDELLPEYEAQVAALPREYHARHILVDDPARAEALNKQARDGADFAALAKKNSKDSSAEQGGDLGWFTLDTMVEPFSNAVAELEPGQVSAQPVQSQFGWHVIKLEETRDAPAPPFVDVKERVRVLLQRKKLQAHLDALRAAAKVEILQSAPEEAPEAAEAVPNPHEASPH